ncbi:hypothetical protein DFH06DRAFT_554074 [Mycena polygramma]|nr:hypothetical protein DFH06DRAFT_554074 [Mycena polygramma]
MAVGIFAYLVPVLFLLVLVPYTQCAPSALGRRAVSDADSGIANVFHATTSFHATNRLITPNPPFFHGKRSQSSSKLGIADPIIIGLSVCLVIAGGITCVYFHQRAKARRAATNTNAKPESAELAIMELQRIRLSATINGPTVRSIHEDELAPRASPIPFARGSREGV